MKRKITSILAVVLILATVLATSAMAASPEPAVTVRVNGMTVDFPDGQPYAQNALCQRFRASYSHGHRRLEPSGNCAQGWLCEEYRQQETRQNKKSFEERVTNSLSRRLHSEGTNPLDVP